MTCGFIAVSEVVGRVKILIRSSISRFDEDTFCGYVSSISADQ